MPANINLQDSSYIKTTWEQGDLLTEENMNKIENGIEGICNAINTNNEAIETAIGNIKTEITEASGAVGSTLGQRIDDLVILSDTQPQNKPNNEIWVNTSTVTNVSVPTYEEFEALEHSVASEYDAGSPYAIGDLVIHEHELYRCKTAITNGEAWTVSHWAKITVEDEFKLRAATANEIAEAASGEVTDLKNAFNFAVDLNNLISEIIVGTWTNNTAIRFDNGAANSSINFRATEYLPVTPGETIKLPIPVYKSSAGARTDFGLMFYTSAKEHIANAGYRMKLATSDNTAEIVNLIVPETAAYARTTWYMDTATYDWDGEFQIIRYPAVEVDGNLIELGQDEINEYYGIMSSGISAMSLWGVTSYIDCHGVTTINVKMPVISSSVLNVVGLDFYDQSKVKLSFVPVNRGTDNGAEMRTLVVPEEAYYFRTTYWKTDNAKLYGGDFYCSFYTNEYGKFRPYQNGYIFYSPLVNQSVNQYWKTDLDTELGDEMKQTTGVLLLPENYDPNGKPVPVIMYFHGYSHYVYYDHWGDDEAFRTQKAQWAALGFAVLDCNGARNNNKAGHFTSGGSLQYSDGYHKCFEYVKQHYNVEQNCHVICVSAGGIPGINYCYWFNDAKSLQMLSAWTSLKVNQYSGTGQSAPMIEYLGCDFTDGYEATADKTIGFDPTLRILTVDGVKYLPQGKIPMKAFLGSTEQGNHIWNALQNYVTALRNAGQSVSLRIVEGATHKNICSDEILALNTEYANFCKSV